MYVVHAHYSFFSYISAQSSVVFVCTVVFSNVLLTSLILFNSTTWCRRISPCPRISPWSRISPPECPYETDKPMGLSAGFYGIHVSTAFSCAASFVPGVRVKPDPWKGFDVRDVQAVRASFCPVRVLKSISFYSTLQAPHRTSLYIFRQALLKFVPWTAKTKCLNGAGVSVTLGCPCSRPDRICCHNRFCLYQCPSFLLCLSFA